MAHPHEPTLKQCVKIRDELMELPAQLKTTETAAKLLAVNTQIRRLEKEAATKEVK